MLMQEIHIYVTGSVQGVGFRAAVKRHAQLYDIKGYVRNLDDGRVEICAQGKGEQIHNFIHIVQMKPGLGTISKIETQQKPLHEPFFSFEVR
jgi:acylphosphatase